MKSTKKSIVSILCAVVLLAVTVLPLVACTHNAYDNESFPLIFSSEEVDKVFNPFFSTTGADSSVISPTQIGMLTNNSKGEVAYGEKESVVALDLEQTYDDESDTTTYKFVLKNNIKFSDGTLLTIKDVLFNMYVFLDPAYTGSSTMYSTDIVGLKAYRSQSYDEDYQDTFNRKFNDQANVRLSELVECIQKVNEDFSFVADEDQDAIDARFAKALDDYAQSKVTADGNYKYVKSDFEKALTLFKEELNSDYTNALDSYKDTKFKDKAGKVYENIINSDVEMFLYNEGGLTWNRTDGVLEDGFATHDEIYGDGTTAGWVSDADGGKAKAIARVYESNIPDKADQVVSYWQTSVSLYEYMVNDAKEAYFKDLAEKSGKTVPNISGIKFANKDESVTVNGVVYQKAYDSTTGAFIEGVNQVLSITINKVDPKAIWNFSFGVAPLHYYSNNEQIQKFDFESNFGVEFGSQSFMTDVVKDPTKIGVPLGAGPYAASKSSGGIIGDANGTSIKNGDFCADNIIYYERNPYYTYWDENTGKFETGAKVKILRYQVVSQSQMLTSFEAGDIHFAEPNAKPENIEKLNSLKSQGFGHTEVETSGYGYIGINAGKVPSIKVRQAIMHSINTDLCIQYYGTLASPIYRSMSLSNWAYPDDATPYYPYIGGKIPTDLEVVNPDYKSYIEYKRENASDDEKSNYDAGKILSDEDQKEFIQGLIGDENPSWINGESAGYTLVNDVYQKSSDKLRYTFTIAGETDDHPAWNAMSIAATFLNKVGFDITVSTDSNALTKLSTGALTVWAAAWSSTIDPDMYQVYHKDSQATSVLNWGYRQILANETKYAEENVIINQLSDVIEEARSYLDPTDRKPLYKEALDLVMQLAVELPTYQRQDMYVYNGNIIDVSTFTAAKDLSSYVGLVRELAAVSLNVER